jgi:hypothetical protein
MAKTARKAKKKTKSGASIVPSHITAKQVFGSILLARFDEVKMPASLHSPLKTFRTAHQTLKATIATTEDAKSARAHAESEIATVDKHLDVALHTLANVLVGASIGTRQNPFKGISNHAPSALAKLGYSAKVKAARAMVKKLKPKKLPANVSAAVKTIALRADNVAKALGGVSAPDAVVSKARTSLDRVVVTWDTALHRLKTLAAAAWIDDAATMESLIRKPARVQAPKTGGKKKAPGAKAANGATKPAPDVSAQPAGQPAATK